MSGTVPLLSIYDFMVWTGTNLPLPFTKDPTIIAQDIIQLKLISS